MKFRKPRCVLVYALAPDHVTPPEANQAINEMSADRSLPMILWHDHFLRPLGGVALFFVENEDQREALFNMNHLKNWSVEFRPLIYSSNPAAFDEQIAYTMKTYRDEDWETWQNLRRPSYGNPRDEVLSGQEAS